MITVDKGITLPRQCGKHKYPWSEMEVGDSFIYAGENSSAAYASASAASKRYGRKFTARKMDDGYRIWRVA